MVPAARNADGTSSPAGGDLSKSIQTWVKQNYDLAMRFVSYSEVIIFIRVLFGAILFRNSLLAPLLASHVLRCNMFVLSSTR